MSVAAADHVTVAEILRFGVFPLKNQLTHFIQMFERLRAGKGEKGLSEYRALLKAAGIEEE